MLWRIIAAFVLTIALQFVPISGLTRLAAFAVAYLIVGYDILRKALMGMRNGRMFDENFLMSVATLGAFALAVYSGSGDYNEAIAVMLFYQIGELFQSYAVGKSRKSISQLMDIRPDYANIDTGGTIERVDPDDVEVGTTIIVNPGEKIPIDGTVAKGSSSLNTSALTGESVPRDVAEGDEVVSGCINLSSVLHITTTKPFDESTVSKILELLEDSAANKSKSEAFISRFARVYTPFVCYSALALALIPTLLLTLFANHSFVEAFSVWGYRALTFLVISCPCALVVSIPLSFFAGIGGASKAGILVKGSNILETLSKVKTIVFDKTGTLTQGLFTVNATHHFGFDEDNLRCSCHYCSHHHPTDGDMRLLEFAAHAECASSHPISQSLQKAYGKPIDRSRVDNIQEIGGKGIIASVDNHNVAVGNERLMQYVGAAFVHCKSVGTIVHLAIDNVYAGHIVISDVAKPTAKQAIEELHKAGIIQTVMLTGDLKPVADDIGNKLGVDVIYSELLPDGKVKQLEQIINDQPEDRLVAFVGDGINDAPAICRADVGIAMGALGSDAAIEAADIVLMDDDPLKIAKAVEISRRTLKIVWQNIVFALGVKGACLVLGAFGLANMWLAVFADVGVMIIAILNAIRAMRN